MNTNMTTDQIESYDWDGVSREMRAAGDAVLTGAEIKAGVLAGTIRYYVDPEGGYCTEFTVL